MQLFKNRFDLLIIAIKLFLVINLFTRLIFCIIKINNIEYSTIPLIFIIGFFYDLIASLYYFIPLVIYLTIINIKFFNSKIQKYFIFIIFTLILFLTIFNGVSEYFFWEEFGKRFNFIAVDYLVYTTEVIGNIRESYPIPQIIASILTISMFLVFLIKNTFTISDNIKYIYRLKFLGIYIILIFIFFNVLNKQTLTNFSDNIYNRELSKNGIYSLFSAFRHNVLDYYEFYKTIDNKKAFANLRKLENFDLNHSKNFISQNHTTKKNIMFIMVESLSAKYMGIFGNKRNLTPNLDKIAKQSLFFNNLFATGTRTVRGMEAVNLSIPPTAGRSIIKREKNHNLDSFGKILNNKGYENKFIYAGHGYFDNMNDFYSKNDFTIVDRLDFKTSEITFSNIWGVCDDDLFNKSLKEADKSFEKGKPFFNFIMTTSNHRPFTYPNGKINIPSHTGRKGAVKYTDFAINQFIINAKKHKWFKNTIFVIVADHNGGSAGKTTLPLYRYKIPLIIYSPSFIKPQIISKLSSQIDIMPTVLDILGINFIGQFYGNSILNNNFKERAFIGNYQKLGYVKNNHLYFLTPDKKIHKMKIEKLGLNSVKYIKEKISLQETEEIITYYQSAFSLYLIHN